MSKIDELIAELCPDVVRYSKIKEIDNPYGLSISLQVEKL